MPDRDNKLLEHILLRRGDANVEFAALRRLLKQLGFEERVRGDHHIFTKEGMADIINLQPKGSKAKPYQVRQVRTLILRHELTLEER